MTITISGSTGIAGVDGSASTPAVQGTDTNTGIAFPAADTVAIGTGGTERMRVDSSGSVGFGTTSPNKSGSNLALTLNTALGQYGAYELSTNDVGRWYINADATNVYDTAMNNTNRTFYTGGSERARITSGGTLCLNTTNPTVNSKTPLLLSYQTGGGPAISCYVNSTSAVNQITFHNPNGEVGQINTGGTTTSYNTSSDYRLKENVVPLTGAAARVQALKPCRFNWGVDPAAPKVDGFLAHEAAEVVPQAVTGEKDAVNEDGSIKPQGIDHSKLVPLLTAALQEALTEIASLKARLTALEAK